jgi:hypothetical protein
MKQYKKDWLTIIGMGFGIISIVFSFIPSLTDYTFMTFLLSIFTLFHDQYSKIEKSLENTKEHSSRMSMDVKNHLRVIRLDKPARTFNDYVIQRLNIIDAVKNTSFNKSDNHHEADENFNESVELKNAPNIISQSIYNGLKWYDIGDDIAKKRFKIWHECCDNASKTSSNGGYYRSVIVNNRVPYPNFLIITYKDGREEVLFNWDFRLNGIKPNVLVSNEKELIQFYCAQFELLRAKAVPDSDLLN